MPNEKSSAISKTRQEYREAAKAFSQVVTRLGSLQRSAEAGRQFTRKQLQALDDSHVAAITQANEAQNSIVALAGEVLE